jgi:hypothetical protein
LIIAFKGLGIDLGKNFKKSKASLTQLKIRVEALKNLENDPDNFIYECFYKLLNQIDFEREELRARVDLHFLRLIGECDTMEMECKENAKTATEKYKSVLNQFEKKFINLKEDLNKLEIDVESWDKITAESNEASIEIKRAIGNLQNDLVLNKSYSLSFSAKDITIETKVVTETIGTNQLFDEFGIIPKHFSLKSKASNKFIHIEDQTNLAKPLLANGDANKLNTAFEIIYLKKPDIISLRSLMSGKMLSARYENILACVDYTSETEKFIVHFHADKFIGLKSTATGKYLCADKDPNKILELN